MKTIRYLIFTGMATAGIYAPCAVHAQSTPPAPPVVVPHNDTDLNRDLSGVPTDIKGLIVGFDQTRDQYLAQQSVLLAKLKNATTTAEQNTVRDQLQGNRQAFLDSLKDFRSTLKGDLETLKGKISHEEFLRVINTAYYVATEGGPFHHKGH